jgi:hypothetical protein
MVPICITYGNRLIRIPGDIDDLEAFRRWARSDEFPREARFSYLGGELWVDLGEEVAPPRPNKAPHS